MERCTALQTHHFTVLMVPMIRSKKCFQPGCGEGQERRKIESGISEAVFIKVARMSVFTFRIDPSAASKVHSISLATAWGWQTRGQALQLSGSNLRRAGGSNGGEVSAGQVQMMRTVEVPELEQVLGQIEEKHDRIFLQLRVSVIECCLQ